MATLVGTQKELGSLLNNLIELDYDAVAAYEAAIERLHNQGYKERLREFLGDHQRHIIDLKPHAARLCEDVASGPDVKQVLTKGKVIIAKLAGDRAILFAMKTNEDDTNTAYERAVNHDAVTPEVLAVLQRNLADERRHRAWIQQCLRQSEDIEVEEQEVDIGEPSSLDEPRVPPMY
jgi:uncharacterized protein (TIGR02284 family)